MPQNKMNKEFGQLSNEDTAYCRSISIYQFMPNSYCSCRDFLVNTVNRKNGFIQFLNVKVWQNVVITEETETMFYDFKFGLQL